MKNRFWPKFISAIFFLILLEIALRLVGFGNYPLYYKSDKFEYALKPNQSLKRFGNKVFINADGMRSDALGKNEWRILEFGDSVINGGVSTDQKELSSSILETKLKVANSNVRVLNVSAGSWGPDNAYAWLNEKGDFDAKAILLVFSSHDWMDKMTFRDVVGNVPFYPETKPSLAITDAFSWMFSRFITEVEWDDLPVTRKAYTAPIGHSGGWDDFIDYSRRNKLPLIVYHHASKTEMKSGEWSKMGKSLMEFLSDKDLIYISGLESDMNLEDYRDEIHPNEIGQSKIARAIYPELKLIIPVGENE